MGCLEPTDHTCFADARCGLQGFWGDVAQAIDGVFRQTTVADLVARQQEWAPGPVAPRVAAVPGRTRRAAGGGGAGGLS